MNGTCVEPDYMEGCHEYDMRGKCFLCEFGYQNSNGVCIDQSSNSSKN